MNKTEKIKVVNKNGELVEYSFDIDRDKELQEEITFALKYAEKSVHKEIVQSIEDSYKEDESLREKIPYNTSFSWIELGNGLTLNVISKLDGIYRVSLDGKYIGGIQGSYSLIDKTIYDEIKNNRKDKIYLSTFILNKIYGLRDIDPLRISIENIIKEKKKRIIS